MPRGIERPCERCRPTGEHALQVSAPGALTIRDKASSARPGTNTWRSTHVVARRAHSIKDGVTVTVILALVLRRSLRVLAGALAKTTLHCIFDPVGQYYVAVEGLRADRRRRDPLSRETPRMRQPADARRFLSVRASCVTEVTAWPASKKRAFLIYFLRMCYTFLQRVG